MLVGRHAELAQLQSLIGAARSGGGSTVLLQGVAGVGKTALLDHSAASAAGLEVLRATGIPGEAEVAFAGLLDVLRPVLHRLPELPSPQRELLAGALGLAPAAERDRFLTGAATLALLLVAAADRPVLVCVDDAHWLDTPSLEALLFAGRRLTRAPVSMILAARDEPHAALDSARLDVLPVPALDREATSALVATLTGRSLEKDAEEIFRRTQGLPLAVAEWSRLAEDELPMAPVPISSLVERAYVREAERASDAVRSLLLIAAADDSGQVATVRAAAERLGIPAGAEEEAESLRLVEVAEGAIRFRHPLVRSAVYQSAPPALRRRTHEALAGCLTGEWQADRRAWHRAAATAGTSEDVAAELAAVAERARARSGYAVAARALERAARLTPSRESRARRALAAADMYWRAGYGSRAEELLKGSLADAQDPLLRADAEHLLGRLVHWRGDPASAREILVAGALRVEPTDGRRALGLLASAQHPSWLSGRRALVRETAATLVRMSGRGKIADDARLSAMTGAALTICERLDQAAGHLRRSIALASDDDPFALVYAAMSHGWLCEYRAARDLAARALQTGEQQGAAGSASFASEVLSEFVGTLGDFDTAAAIWAETIHTAEEAEQPHTAAWSVMSLAFVAGIREGEEAARPYVERALELERPMWFIGIEGAAWPLATAALARGDGANAAAVLAGTDLEICQANYAPMTMGADLVEAHVRSGEPARARAVLAELEPHAHQPWARAALDRARGVVADEQRFDAPLERSTELFRDLGVRFEEARSRLCLGERLRRAGRRVEARGQLRAALSGFESMRCAPWVERTERELKASGETLRARDAAHPIEALTPQELQVAAMAASGLSNKEIAAQLFLSIKTIEAHLHRVYRKLGIRSRRSLPSVICTGAESATSLAIGDARQDRS
jgi:DNA-binding CsgD family transcriptional regulator